ncbi:UNVERIFIED_CONTAM: hypothetical protein K2H54_022531 [Gekko kuhli]
MQTMGSLLSDCLVDKNGVLVISKDGLNQLVTEMFPHCEKDENLSEGEEIPLQEPPQIFISPENQCNLPAQEKGGREKRAQEFLMIRAHW